MILDCTLRDGGYYNNWDFPKEVVDAYLNAVAGAGIEYVELGLRNFSKKGFLGAYAYTTEQHLNTLTLPSGPTYGVMIDANTILSSSLDTETAVDALFVPCEQSKVDLVRIAAHFHEVERSEAIVTRLKKLGYKVGFNLMQSGGKPADLIAEKARKASSWGENLDVLYFADSLGNMDSQEVKRIISVIRSEWRGQLGIHTHDNLSKGLDNCLTARDEGVEWLDATITGMGRGAGNTQTERLLTVLARESSKYRTQPIYELVIRQFESLQKQYGWGTNLLYFLGAKNNVHPTYIQNLLSNGHFGTEEIIGAIEYLSHLEGAYSYNGDILATALSFNSTCAPVTGTHSLEGLFQGREVLLVANAPSVDQYLEAINQYIVSKKPVVLSLNINHFLDEGKIDYFVMTHNAKFLSESKEYRSLKKPLVLPLHRFDREELDVLEEVETIDYGFDVDAKKRMRVDKTFTVSPYDVTAAYALGVSIVAEADRVSLVGFDGFDKNDPRQIEMIDIMQQYLELGLTIKALTPTSYPLEQGSIYDLN